MASTNRTPSAAPSASPRGPSNSRRVGGGRGRGRGRGGNRGRGCNRDRGGGASSQSELLSHSWPLKGDMTKFKIHTDAKEGVGDENDEVCFICANPVMHFSIAPCNHITCHICTLRLRALYKTKDCPHCRTAAPWVIFTNDSKKPFDAYESGDISSSYEELGIKFGDEDIVGDTLLLLRFNCPDVSCDYSGLGWPDLHRHARQAHHKKMCDLCTRNKKVFTHEHDLLSERDLSEHMRWGNDRLGAAHQTGFKGHPLCNFCGERFYDGDKLYEHCRNKHERCFICDRQDSQQPHYYLDYNTLEEHFKHDHYMCPDKECLDKKFVVFESEMDLKAHQATEHGTSLSKNARLVDMSAFSDFRAPFQLERRGGGSSREDRSEGRSREGRGRGRDPNVDQPHVSSEQPLRRDEFAFQRQMAIHSAHTVSTSTFGAYLTRPANEPSARSSPDRGRNKSTSSAQQAAPAPRNAMLEAMETLNMTEVGSLTPDQRARLTRHGAVIERAGNLVGNDSHKVNRFRNLISCYNRGQSTADGLVMAFRSLFSNTSNNALAALLREVADLFDDKQKGEALRRAWQNWRNSIDDHLSLSGEGGMRGATTASSCWAAAASATPATMAPGMHSRAKQSTQVLRLKNTRGGSSCRTAAEVVGAGGISSSNGGGPADHSDPPAPAAATFPALPDAARAGSPQQQQQSSGWRVVGTAPARRPGRSVRNDDNFPALPSVPKPTATILGYGTGTVRRDFGNQGTTTSFSWGLQRQQLSQAGASRSASTAERPAEAAGDGKGKKKQKKVQLDLWA